MRKQILLLTLFFSLFTNAQIQEIKVVDQYLFPIQGVEVTTSKLVLGLTNEVGLVPLPHNNMDSALFVFIHQAYYTQTLTYAELKAQNFTVSLRQSTSSLTPVYVTAGRLPRLRNDVALSIDMIKKEEVELHQPQTTADLIGLGQKVFIQKSQMGGGSPMVRGFATNRILLVVDDIRMNTAIFRSGNVHNIISIDPFLVEEAEVIFGPASQFYGSDAIGGVLSFKTKQIEFSDSIQKNQAGNFALKLASVNSERTIHLDFTNAGKYWGSLTSVTLSQFGDLKMGTNGPDQYTQELVAIPFQNGDSVIENSDPNFQRFTGYDQINLAQKIEYKKDNIHLGYGLVFSNIPEIPRYDRLIQLDDNDTPRYAEWYYGPQFWLMNRFFFKHHKEHLLYDFLKFNAAYQLFKESRIDRRLYDPSRRVRQERVDAYSLNIDLEKRISNHLRFNYGAEYIINTIGSKGYSDSAGYGEELSIASRYPDGSSWQSAGLYLNLFKRFSPIYTLETGVRLNAFSVNGELDDSFYPFPVTEINNKDIGATYSLAQNLSFNSWRTGLILSTAYRAPNIDDISKVFDSNQGSVVIPNTELSSEYAYNAEINVESPNWKGFRFMLSAFYTYLDRAIILDKGTFNGNDSIFYDGVKSQVFQLNNTDYAVVQGIQLDLKYQPDSFWTFKANYTGLASNSKGGYPTRHITPNYGSVHLEYHKKQWTIDLSIPFQQSFNANQFSLSELTDAYLYLKDDNGNPYSPAWHTIDIYGRYRINQQVSVNAGIENILDKRFRTYSSGVVAPGRNFMLSLRSTF